MTESSRYKPLTKLVLSTRKAWWYCVGMFSLGLGIIGAFLPVMPTTVFIILAAFCFSKGSPETQKWLEDTKNFGPLIKNWRKTGAIALRHKFIAISMIAVAFLIGYWLNIADWVLTIQLIALLACAGYILTRPNA